MCILNLGTARSIIKTTNNFASPAADNELFLARTANEHASVKVVRYVETRAVDIFSCVQSLVSLLVCGTVKEHGNQKLLALEKQ